jgi:hypothetical protein
MTSNSAAGPRQKTVTPRSPLAMATGEETFSAIADQRRGFVTAAMILQFESPTLGGCHGHGRAAEACSLA